MIDLEIRNALGLRLGFVKGAIQLISDCQAHNGLENLPNGGEDVGYVLYKVEEYLGEIEDIIDGKGKPETNKPETSTD